MTLTVGELNYTEFLQEGTLAIRRYGTLRSSFSATLQISNRRIAPRVGEEILVKDGNRGLIWGGILVEVTVECHHYESITVRLRGQGYEHLLQRFCLPRIELPALTPSQAVLTVFANYIPEEEGLSLGEFDTEASESRQYSLFPEKASSVLDFLTRECGAFWWIDGQKRFHVGRTLPESENEISIDLTEQDAGRLTDLQTLTFRSSTAGYRNVQYVFNRSEGICARDINAEETAIMRARYGSGQYGAALSNSSVLTEGSARQIASGILNSASGTDEIEITTDAEDFSLGQAVPVTAPVCGILTPKIFYVSEICAVYFADRFRYTVILGSNARAGRTTSDWEAVLAGRATETR